MPLESFNGISVTVADAVASSTRIPYRNSKTGNFVLISGDCVAITWYGAWEKGGTLYPAFDGAATPAAVAQANLTNTKGYPIPSALAGYEEIAPQAGSSTSGVMRFIVKE